LNDGKVGHPFKITDGYIVFLAVVRYHFSMPYRQLEGFARALSGYDGLVAIAVDSSGVSVHKCGGWVERLYGGRKRYVKIRFAVDVRTREVLAMNATTDDIHDSKALLSIMADALRHRLISEAYMNGAYDSKAAKN